MTTESPAQRARLWRLLCVLHIPYAVGVGVVCCWEITRDVLKISFTWLSQGRVGDRRFGGSFGGAATSPHVIG